MASLGLGFAKPMCIDLFRLICGGPNLPPIADNWTFRYNAAPTSPGLHTSHTASQLRDGALGSGRRLDGHQQALGPQQLYDDHDLSSLSQAALGFYPEPARLVAREAMPAMRWSKASRLACQDREAS